jgi:hypothetical protein
VLLFTLLIITTIFIVIGIIIASSTNYFDYEPKNRQTMARKLQKLLPTKRLCSCKQLRRANLYFQSNLTNSIHVIEDGGAIVQLKMYDIRILPTKPE